MPRTPFSSSSSSGASAKNQDSKRPLKLHAASMSDPLDVVLRPPPNESLEERQARIDQETAAKKRSEAIDKWLESEKREHEGSSSSKQKRVKLLVLGPSQAGKTTFLKQMRLLYDSDNLDHERALFRIVIYITLIASLRHLLAKLDSLRESERDRERSSQYPRRLPSRDGLSKSATTGPSTTNMFSNSSQNNNSASTSRAFHHIPSADSLSNTRMTQTGGPGDPTFLRRLRLAPILAVEESLRDEVGCVSRSQRFKEKHSLDFLQLASVSLQSDAPEQDREVALKMSGSAGAEPRPPRSSWKFGSGKGKDRDNNNNNMEGDSPPKNKIRTKKSKPSMEEGYATPSPPHTEATTPPLPDSSSLSTVPTVVVRQPPTNTKAIAENMEDNLPGSLMIYRTRWNEIQRPSSSPGRSSGKSKRGWGFPLGNKAGNSRPGSVEIQDRATSGSATPVRHANDDTFVTGLSQERRGSATPNPRISVDTGAAAQKDKSVVPVAEVAQLLSECLPDIQDLCAEAVRASMREREHMEHMKEKPAPFEGGPQRDEIDAAVLDLGLGRPELYFLDQVDRLAQPNYSPTNADLLQCRVKTMGLDEYIMEVENTIYHVCDVSGSRGSRPVWAPHFQDSTAVIFVLDVSAYDTPLPEDQNCTRMQDAIALFISLASNPFLSSVPFIIFLNKTDLLKEKLAGRGPPISKFFPTFNPPEPHLTRDYDTVMKFFKDTISTATPNPNRDLYIFSTTCIDSKKMRVVINSVRDILLRTTFRQAGLFL